MLVFASASVAFSANTPPIAKDRIRADPSTAFEIKLILASLDVKPASAGYQPLEVEVAAFDGIWQQRTLNTESPRSQGDNVGG
jgi:hypothetical protein